MQENKDHAADSPQASELGQGDSSSVSLHNSKLRNKLEKLAQWRIDPSFIKFPQDVREFRGGYATVSQAFLVPFSGRAVANESEHPMNEGPDSNVRSAQSQSVTQEAKDGQQGRDEGVNSYTAVGDSDHTKGDGRKDTVQDSGDWTGQSQSNTGGPGGGWQGKGDETGSCMVDCDDGRAKEENGEESTNDEKQKPHPHTPIQKIVYESIPSDRTADGDPDSSSRSPQPQSDIQERGDDQQSEGTGDDKADAGGDQTKEGARKEHENTNEEHDSDPQASEPKIVAVKKLKIEGDTDLERVLGLALRESEFLGGLSHPNIVKLEGFVEDLAAPKIWLIFPWEEHGNLRDFLASGEWEIPERISLINDVTLGLEYLHGQEPPIYHGDLKSLNILVNSECHALITDFGSARHLENDRVGKQPKENKTNQRPVTDTTTSEEHITLEAFFSATASTITLTGSSYTLRWAAPELLQEDEPCLRSDIWALGWIAYEVMTNTIPFHDIKQDAIVINRVVQGQLPSVTDDARMSLIRALCSLMVRCWSMNPDKRPTAEECRKLISWMPSIAPASTRIIVEEASQLRYAQLLNELGYMYRRQSDYPSALRHFNEALNIYTNDNQSMGRAETLCGLAAVYRFQNEHIEATAFYSEALQIYADVGDESGRVNALLGMAEARRLLRESDEAARLYSECLQISTNIDWESAKAIALWGLADVHQSRAEYSEAINLYSEALQIFTNVGYQRERASTLLGLGRVHQFQREYSEAINLYTEAVEIFLDLGEHKERADTLWALAEVHRLQGGYSEATKLYSECLQIYSTTGTTKARATTLWGLAQVHRAQHKYDEATQLFSEATEIFTDVGDKYWEAESLLSLAKTHEIQDHHSEAISFYTQASEALSEIGDHRRAGDAVEKASLIRKSLEGASEGLTESDKGPLSSSE